MFNIVWETLLQHVALNYPNAISNNNKTTNLYIRLEEEQRRLREREKAKLRQAEAMREVLEAAERLAKEQKKNRRKRDESDEESTVISSRNCESNASNVSQLGQDCPSVEARQSLALDNEARKAKEEKETLNEKGSDADDNKEPLDVLSKPDQGANDAKSLQVPISKDVAIVLSGRLEEPELLNKANLQLVNLVLTPTPTRFDNNPSNLSAGLNALVQNSGAMNFACGASRIPSTIVEDRLLTPSKYRLANGRDFGTQTDVESDLQDFREKMQGLAVKDLSTKDRKDATNASKRDIEK